MKRTKTGQEQGRSVVSSLTRLTIGGLLIGYDGLTKRLAAWETEIDRKEDPRDVQHILNDDELSVAHETETDHLRHAAIGMIFTVGEALNKNLKTADRVSRLAGELIETVVGPVYSSRIVSPIRQRVDRLAERGQSQVAHWIEVGREEEIRSRSLASTALTEQVDSSIQYLTSNEEVQELVKSQSVGLVGEIVEETRERTVSADNYLEAWVRTMLRRPMRSSLPEPTAEIKARAIPLRRVQGKVVHK